MAIITPFTPVASTIGGMLIGLSAVLLMLFNGRIAGISGILARMFPPYGGTDVASAVAFVAGLMAAPLCYSAVIGAPVPQTVSANAILMAIAGLLVGFGTVYGGGCTSGHGVCGLARLASGEPKLYVGTHRAWRLSPSPPATVGVWQRVGPARVLRGRRAQTLILLNLRVGPDLRSKKTSRRSHADRHEG